MTQRSKNRFTILWIACVGLTFFAGGFGRTSQGKPFFASFDTPLQSVFYAVGGVIACIMVGWLLAKLIERFVL